ncbi:hypothetical protein GE09DRAFT_82182 [Coniochaeta sp. 2T2.1]|nr:hypothetical protein GE09DRAFT_82182 [Coniochaeta sp. 2T2.1]
MKVAAILASVLVAAVSSTALSVSLPRDDTSDGLTQSPELAQLLEHAKAKIVEQVSEQEQKLRKRGIAPKCTASKIAFRQEYGSLSEQQRLNYINAIKCLQKKPARTPQSLVPGARSRFDDFVAVHINQTLTIHYSGWFMPWHRWFIYQYEKALRDECGFTGYLPYWDWPRYARSPETSPLFDGSPYSLGGNGEFIPHDGPVIVPPEGIGGGNIQLPAGTGGGYVRTGPFANMTVNLGPVGGVLGTPPGPLGGLGYNPRFMKRDLGGAMNTRYANYTTVLDLLTTCDIDAYRHVSEGVPYTPEIGPHGGVHYTIGGDPGGDLFTSPGDPAFYAHHSQMDRMWAVWQALGTSGGKRYTDLGKGPYAHLTWTNEPPSRFIQLTDVIDMGYAAPSTTVGSVMSTLGGEFCYFYL